ncbi:hypothetical protein EPHNCH_1590 [Anaplasma phagocytophilum str. NCH-1]|uniref:Uncharacterized protein n=1 Tax=Anaplasma phagocytophilum str. NCH-1 TaxID=1359161 RepID=A0A0F3MUM4_ANAPH|nr:hypothetical protein EPHNCH_1622 [Anaplasma phagocytophilum str. NCH-1]KJV59455.1 hypothetical protein EPHNCH_1590 [Anaplasma phagocytophilum str. NCH-1]
MSTYNYTSKHIDAIFRGNHVISFSQIAATTCILHKHVEIDCMFLHNNLEP